jgi:pyrroline-5-carboxylate reductase
MEGRMKVGILGAGNMGGAIVRGCVRGCGDAGDVAGSGAGGVRSGGSGNLPGGAEVFVFDPESSKVEALAGLDGVTAVSGIDELLERADIVILAVKPQVFGEVVPRMAELLAGSLAGEGGAPGVSEDAPGDSPGDASGCDSDSRGKVFVSIAAGISIGWLAGILGAGAKIVRVMPNTPAMVGEGMSAISRSESVTDVEFAAVSGVFGAVGRVAAVPEELLDAVTGISGSSPAYAYMYMQALIESGVRHGLSEDDARLFAAQSTLGAAKMVMENADVSVERMRENVCSPGGTTIEAVKTLEKEGFMDTVKRAVYACVEKSKRMRK